MGTTDLKQFSVPAELAGERIDRIVSQQSQVPRSLSRSWCEQGLVTLDARPVSASHRVTEAEIYRFPAAGVDPVLEPIPVDFGVVFEDSFVVVVNKPAGLTVHPGKGGPFPTLAAGLLDRFPDIKGVGDEGRWGLVHRLDRDTSGLMVVARNTEAFQHLREQMNQRLIERVYLGLVVGVVETGRGTIDAPIRSDPKRPGKKQVGLGGRSAVTHYQRIRTYQPPGVTLLEITLETGRTHQIRVHTHSIGHPVLGDPWYGQNTNIGSPPRLMLHATRLTFSHPKRDKPMTLEVPPPQDFGEVLANLERQQTGRVIPID